MTKLQTKLKTEPFRRGGTGNKGGRIKGHQQLLHQKKVREGHSRTRNANEQNEKSKQIEKQNITRSFLGFFFHDFHTHLAYID